MARWQNRSMTNEQLYLAIGIPLLFNSALTIGLWLNVRNTMAVQFAAVNQRFDDMRDLRSELRIEHFFHETPGGAVK